MAKKKGDGGVKITETSNFGGFWGFLAKNDFFLLFFFFFFFFFFLKIHQHQEILTPESLKSDKNSMLYDFL